jgi:hypothetical protein
MDFSSRLLTVEHQPIQQLGFRAGFLELISGDQSFRDTVERILLCVIRTVKIIKTHIAPPYVSAIKKDAYLHPREEKQINVLLPVLATQLSSELTASSGSPGYLR